MSMNFLQKKPWRHSGAQMAAMALAMLALFIIDTATSFEIAVSVFYTVVIVAMSHVLALRGLMLLTASCVAMTWLSFGVTTYGDYRTGFINMLISSVAIVITGYLACRAQTARAAAHEAQDRLLRISRIQSLESLTTSIAHEINQPLAGIVTSGHACQRWMAQEPPNLDKARQALDRILADADRVSGIIMRVRNLSKGAPAERSAFAFNAAVQEVLALSRAEMQRLGLELDTRLAPDLPEALADRVQIQQVIANLLLNAMEASAAGAATPRAIVVESCCEQDKLLLRVTDGGIGLPAGAPEQVFEPFWTTKPEGVGIGLSISRTLVEAHGGQIWAEAHAQGGAVLVFSVPVARKEGQQ